MLKEEDIKKAMDDAYAECGDNAYFGEGFRKGVKFAMDYYLKKHYNTTDFKVMEIESAIINKFGFTFKQLAIKNRGGKELLPRQISMYMLDLYSSLNQTEIGNLFNRDHATVVSSKKTVNNLMDTDKEISSIVSELKEAIK